jgi:hypothetical protein
MQELKNARKKLEDKVGTSKLDSTQQQKPAKNKFTRVAIQEESDEDEDASKPSEGGSF